MKWTDSQALAEALAEHHPQVDPRRARFTELRAWVLALPGFDDAPERCGERVLEALQQAWIDELG
ncbi:Fe-S cluster assembly protein IscX [Immundisolibacter sp.]|uniref:Fe-S cluster assembly protein IscX n=1 Tax=Immundisolibacter sp. TaxID=1934948 RepID=UPI002603BE12|nr:Fe-S cluster assembly protein IscX [Immundisolibacter sp.]MDD3649985.1 Fe-S cluster assembly protein IscX [Immundisolibacter sp.]